MGLALAHIAQIAQIAQLLVATPGFPAFDPQYERPLFGALADGTAALPADVAAARKFYTDVVGWETEDQGGPHHYVVFKENGVGRAGLMAIPPDAKGMPPAWTGYIAVDDVDAATAKLKREGGTVIKEPQDIPGIIRFAVVADPQGAGFLIAKGMVHRQMSAAAPGATGTIGWHELYAQDGAAIWPFYEKMFGWTKAEALDMGPMGTYQMFKTGGDPVGGIMTKPPQVPVTFWGFYINVPTIDAAVARVTKGGGKIINGPMQVPGGSWIVQAIDPQGAYFNLVAAKRWVKTAELPRRRKLGSE